MRTSFSWRLIVQVWAGLLALGLALWFTITYAGLILEVMGVLSGALLVSLAIYPLADFLARWRVPRGLTVLGVYVGLAIVLILLGGLLIPVVRAEVTLLKTEGPTLLQGTISRLSAMPLLSRWLPSSITVSQQLVQRMDTLLQTLVGAASSVGSLVLDLVMVLILAYFFATGAGIGEDLLRLWVPDRHQPRAREVIEHLCRRLTRWVWARLAVAVYFGVTFGAGLALVGVPFAFTISLVGGVLEIVPYLGSGVALVLALLSALTVQPLKALWVILLFTILVEIKGHIVEPAFYGRAIGLHPAVVLVALLVGVKLGGVWGLLFAVPAAVVLVALLEQVRPVLSGRQDP